MPKTAMTTTVKSLAKNRGYSVERGWEDKFNLVRSEVTPDEVANRLDMAARGIIGPLQGVYAVMETDARYSGILNSLKADVAGCPIRVFQSDTKSRGSKTAYNLVKEQYRRINNVSLLRMLCKPYYRGLAAWEMVWEIQNSSYAGREVAFIKELVPIPGTRLLVNLDPNQGLYGEVRIVSQKYANGRPITDYPDGVILYADEGDIEPGYQDMAGAARRCLSWWLAKTYHAVFWTSFNETQGEAVRYASVPDNYGSEDMRKLEQYLKYLGRNMYGIFDEEVDITLLEGNRSSTVNTYQTFINLANDEMAIGLVGQVQTSGGGKEGSYAKAAVQYRVLRSIKVAVAAMIEEILYEMNLQFCRHNIDEDFDPSDLPIVKPIVPRPEDRETLVKFYDMATKIVDIPVRQIRQELDIEEAIDGEETVGPEDRSKLDQFRSPGAEDPAASSDSEDRKPRSTGEQETDSPESE